jgi:hypothetical protein
MLPLALIILVGAVLAQRQQQQLAINELKDDRLLFSDVAGIPFTIPPKADNNPNTRLVLSISLCSSSLPAPRFFLTDFAAVDTGQMNGRELFLDGGIGFWNLTTLPRGGIVSVFPGPTLQGVTYPPWPFQIALSDSGMSSKIPCLTPSVLTVSTSFTSSTSRNTSLAW